MELSEISPVDDLDDDDDDDDDEEGDGEGDELVIE
jgi:hypothetical protein